MLAGEPKSGRLGQSAWLACRRSTRSAALLSDSGHRTLPFCAPALQDRGAEEAGTSLPLAACLCSALRRPLFRSSATMPAPYSKDVVEKVVISYVQAPPTGEGSQTLRQLAARHNVSLGFVSRVTRGWEDGLSLQELATVGKKGTLASTRLLTPEVLRVLRRLVRENETAYLDELAELLDLHTGVCASTSTICRGLQLLKISRKLVRGRLLLSSPWGAPRDARLCTHAHLRPLPVQLYQRAQEADAARQLAFRQAVSAFSAEQLVFVDEVGMVGEGPKACGSWPPCPGAEWLPLLPQDNRTHQRRRGWSPVGERTTTRHIFVKNNRDTALVVMDSKGMRDWAMVHGGMGSQDLCTAARRVLVRCPCGWRPGVGALGLRATSSPRRSPTSAPSQGRTAW